MDKYQWVESFTVHSYETDVHNTLAIRSLCDYLQEAAGNHARALGVSIEALRERNLTWILSRLRLRIVRPPVAGERLAVHTWPAGAEKLFALRDFRVADSGGNWIAFAVSAWLVFDTSSRRPVRIQSIFDPPEATGIPRALENGIERLPALDCVERETALSVRFSDLDLNMHVNNTRFADWIVESTGPEIWQRFRLGGIDIDFMAETRFGDAVTARVARMADGHFRHGLFRVDDGREVARAETAWV